jgi:hypothetical protein
MSNQMLDIKENSTGSDPGSMPHREGQPGVQQLYGLTVDTAVLFSDHKNIYKRRIEKRQRKLLSKLGFLAPFLEPGEKIRHIVMGFTPASFVEQLLTGAFLHPLKRCLFVITNRRILHIPTKWRASYACSISQIMYADCQKLVIRGSTLIAKYKSGLTEKFRCIGHRGKKKLKALIEDVPLEGRASQTIERTHLCPRCTRPLIKDVYSCPNCSLEFKTKAWATTLSIIFPGGGYFYARHPFLGIFGVFMEILLAFLLAVSSIALFISSPQAPQLLYQAVGLCAIAFALEKLTTALFSSKCVEEFIPRQRHVEVQIDKVLADRNGPKSEEMLATGWRSR